MKFKKFKFIVLRDLLFQWLELCIFFVLVESLKVPFVIRFVSILFQYVQFLNMFNKLLNICDLFLCGIRLYKQIQGYDSPYCDRVIRGILYVIQFLLTYQVLLLLQFLIVFHMNQVLLIYQVGPHHQRHKIKWHIFEYLSCHQYFFGQYKLIYHLLLQMGLILGTIRGYSHF